jgi:6-phosphogluconolactonase (cycloisomerase 2 family)
MSAPGPDPSRQEKPHPHSVFPDPTGRFLLSADLGADLIRIFSIDASTGKLTACPAAATGAGDGPRHGEFWKSPSGALYLYVVNELGWTVTVWTVTTPPAGAGGCLSLSKIQSAPTYPPGKTGPVGSKSAEVHVSGNFVYATNRNDQSFGSKQDSAATFSIEPSTGKLTFVEATNTHTYFPRTFAINKAGDMVAFGGQTSSTVVVVSRNASTGRLGDVVAQLQVGAPGTVNNEDGLSAVVWDE